MKTSKNQILTLFAYKSGTLMFVPYSEYMKPLESDNLYNSYMRAALKELIFIVQDNKLEIIEPIHGQKLSSYDAIYFRIWQSLPFIAKAVATYASRHNIPFVGSEPARVSNGTKLNEYAVLADNDLPLINSICGSRKRLAKYLRDNSPLAFPLFAKPINGSLGDNTSLMNNQDELGQYLKDTDEEFIMLQEFVPNDCDYRIIVLGGEVEFVMRRERTSGIVNNTSQGGVGTLVAKDELDAKVLTDAVKAAELLEREDFSGVDVIVDSETGQHYILEVNRTPQIETGAHVDDKVAVLDKYFASLITKGKAK